MASQDKHADVASQIFEWAAQEMHFRPQGTYQGALMPTPDDLRRVCRGAHLTDVWKYVIDHVHSIQTVKHVKGNLKLKGRPRRAGYTVKYKSEGHYDDEQQSLLTQQDQLQGKITAVLSETRHLEKELERMEADIQAAELVCQKEMELQRDSSRKTCLLQVYAQTLNNYNDSIDTFANRIDTRTHSFVQGKKGVDSVLCARMNNEGTAEETADAQFETTTSKEVRTTCNQIGHFLDQMLQGSFSNDKASFNTTKDQLWKQIEMTLSEHNIQQIVSSLIQHSKQGAKSLREHTLKISIHEDAEKLRFKYERGGLLTDIAEQPSVLQSVQQLLEGLQLQHVMRFVETKKYNNAAHPLLKQLENTRNKIDAHLKKIFPAQPGNLQMAKMLVDSQLGLVGDRTARDRYREEAVMLREKVCSGQANREAVHALHRSIHQFQEMADAKQNVIQVVAKQNAGAKSRLAAQQLDVWQYIEKHMPNHGAEMQAITSSLRQTIPREAEQFSSLSLPYLVYLCLDSQSWYALLDLSINFNGHPTAISVRQPLHDSLTHLHFPAFKAAECILPHCLHLKQDQADNLQLTQAYETYCFNLLLNSGLQSDIDHISELCLKVKEQDKIDLDALLPPLQKRFRKAAHASAECIKLKGCVQDWWDQPAQFTTPWVTKEGMTFQQWYNKWRIIVTKIRQVLDV